jgi:hypothetical protein
MTRMTQNESSTCALRPAHSSSLIPSPAAILRALSLAPPARGANSDARAHDTHPEDLHLRRPALVRRAEARRLRGPLVRAVQGPRRVGIGHGRIEVEALVVVRVRAGQASLRQD